MLADVVPLLLRQHLGRQRDHQTLFVIELRLQHRVEGHQTVGESVAPSDSRRPPSGAEALLDALDRRRHCCSAATPAEDVQLTVHLSVLRGEHRWRVSV